MNNVLRIPTTMRPVLREDIVLFEDHYAAHVVQYRCDHCGEPTCRGDCGPSNSVTQLPGYEVTEHSADEIEHVELVGGEAA